MAEEFSASEQAALAPYFTSLTGPVFALVDLPEVVKGALFARYSRSPKSLRRLFVDEFVGAAGLSAAADRGAAHTVAGTQRAEQLYERVLSEYGDDSVAQLGGVHLACEGASNLLTKVLEWGRLMAYLEQSTRYIPYDDRPDGRYRYHVPAELTGTLRDRYVATLDRCFDTYRAWLPKLRAFYEAKFPRDPAEAEGVYRMTIRAKALDTLRGLLPAATTSNVGIYGTGQGYEQLLLRMRAHPLREVRDYAELMLVELRKVIPAFLKRLDVPERGGAWSAYLEETRRETREVVRRLVPPMSASRTTRTPDAVVALTDFDPDGEVKIVAAALYAVSSRGDAELLETARRMTADERTAVLAAYVGKRLNRRHKPGRAFERTSYRFDVCCGPRLCQARGDRRGRRRRGLASRAGGLGRAPRRDRSRGIAGRRRVRGVDGVSRPLLHGDERARGDARDRAAHDAAGTPVVPADLPGHAPAHRRAPSGHRRRDDVR